MPPCCLEGSGRPCKFGPRIQKAALGSAKAQRVTGQLTKFEGAKVLDVEAALSDAAQQKLVGSSHKLVSVHAPDWLLPQTGSGPSTDRPTSEKLD